MNMNSRPPADYVLLESDGNDEVSAPATDIFHLLVGKTIPTEVNIPAITISQYSNQMLFHHTILSEVEINMRHALRERNAALVEVNRLRDIQESKTLNSITLYKSLLGGSVLGEDEAAESLLKKYAEPVIKTALNDRIAKEEIKLQTQEAKYKELKGKRKELRAELFRCKAEISKVEQQVKDSKQEPGNKAYLQMTH
jgi:hypothetical protein